MNVGAPAPGRISIAVLLAALSHTIVAAERDAALEYGLSLDRPIVHLGQRTTVRFYCRNTGEFPIRIYGPILHLPTRNVRSRPPFRSLIPRQWETLGPGEAKYLVAKVPADVGFTDQSIGEHPIMIQLGHTSDGEVFRLSRSVTLTVRPFSPALYRGFERYWTDGEACDTWDGYRRVPVRSFDLDRAREDSFARAYSVTGSTPQVKSGPLEEYRRFFHSEPLQSYLELESRHQDAAPAPNLIFAHVSAALRGQLNRKASRNHFEVDVPWQAAHSRTALWRIDLAAYIVQTEGRAAALQYLRSLQRQPLRPFDAAVLGDVVRLINAED